MTLFNKLPTQDYLFRCGVIVVNSTLCSEGCGDQETCNHLFLLSNVFRGIWARVLNWLGVFSVFSNYIISHATQFGGVC
jgi:hypothetical protein